eukprot:4954038-Amphidinium_carterae.1
MLVVESLAAGCHFCLHQCPTTDYSERRPRIIKDDTSPWLPTTIVQTLGDMVLVVASASKE